MIAPTTPPLGRRERKKLATREALIDAAFELFARKGFEATTVEEIADAVDVSSRTFFRYFASKEDVALTFQTELFEVILTALRARPGTEPVMTALRHAVVGVAHAVEQGELGFDPGRLRLLMTLQGESPALNASSLERAAKKQRDLTAVVADRMGVDAATDMRPHVVAATAGCAFHATQDLWECAGTTQSRDLSSTLDEAFSLLEHSINYPAKEGPAAPAPREAPAAG